MMWLFVIGVWMAMLLAVMACENCDKEKARIGRMARQSRHKDLCPKPKRCSRYVG